MENSIFERELKTLSMLVENWSSDELFTSSYAELLDQVKIGTDPDMKYGQLLRMKKLALIQTGFLMNGYLRAQRAHHAIW